MPRFRSAFRAATAVALLSLVLVACRVPNETVPASPGATGYPGPIAQPTTKVSQAVTPTPPAAVSPSPAGPAGIATLTLTVLHTSDVSGEVGPCG